MMQDFLDDIKAFGGTPVFVFAIVFAFFSGYGSLSLQLLLGYVICLAVTVLCRLVYFKQRPDKTKHKSWVSKLDASSFPSMHSMRAFFLAYVLARHFDNVFLILLFFAFALATAIIRVVRKRHHKVDVIVGAIIGLIIGYVLSFI